MVTKLYRTYYESSSDSSDVDYVSQVFISRDARAYRSSTCETSGGAQPRLRPDFHHVRVQELYRDEHEKYRQSQCSDLDGEERYLMSGALHSDDAHKILDSSKAKAKRTFGEAREYFQRTRSSSETEAVSATYHCGERGCRRCNRGHPGSVDEREARPLKGILKNANRHRLSAESREDEERQGRKGRTVHNDDRKSVHRDCSHDQVPLSRQERPSTRQTYDRIRASDIASMKAEAGSFARIPAPATALTAFDDVTEGIRADILATHQSWCNGSCYRNGMNGTNGYHCEQDATRRGRRGDWPFPPCRTFVHCDQHGLGRWLRKCLPYPGSFKDAKWTLMFCYAEVYVCGVGTLTVEQYRAFLKHDIPSRVMRAWLKEGGFARRLDEIRVLGQTSFEQIRYLTPDQLMFLHSCVDELRKARHGWRDRRRSCRHRGDLRAWTGKLRPVWACYAA